MAGFEARGCAVSRLAVLLFRASASFFHPLVFCVFSFEYRSKAQNRCSATRNTSEYLFYPRHYNLTNIWSDKWVKMTVGHEASAAVLSGDEVPGLYRRAGFGADKIEYFNVVPLLYFGEEGRNFYHKTFCEKMRDAEFKSAWVNTGFTEVELEEATEALDRWAMDEDAWGVNLHNDLVWRK